MSESFQSLFLSFMGNRKIQSQQLAAPLFQRSLRRMILNVPSRARVSPFIFMKKLFATLSSAVFLLVLGMVVHSSSSIGPDLVTPSRASAQEMVSQMTLKIQSLTTEELEDLERDLHIEKIYNVLEEAHETSDLTELLLDPSSQIATNDQAYHFTRFGSYYYVVNEAGYQEILRLHLLAFTLSDESHVFMQINEDMFPSGSLTFKDEDLEDGPLSSASYWNEGKAFTHHAVFSFNPELSEEENEVSILNQLPALFVVEDIENSFEEFSEAAEVHQVE